MSGAVTSKARAIVTIEVRDLGTWNKTASVEEINKHAKIAARNRINEISGIQIVGEPKITIVTIEDVEE